MGARSSGSRGKSAHGSKRNGEGALLGPARPARGGLSSWGNSSIPALWPRPGSGRGGSQDASPGRSTSKRSCSKNLVLVQISSLSPRARAGDGDAASRRWWDSGRWRPTTEAAGYGEQGKRREQEQHPRGCPARRRVRSRADAVRFDQELPPPGRGQAVSEGGETLGQVRGRSGAAAVSPHTPMAVPHCPAPVHPGLGPPKTVNLLPTGRGTSKPGHFNIRAAREREGRLEETGRAPGP